MTKTSNIFSKGKHLLAKHKTLLKYVIPAVLIILALSFTYYNRMQTTLLPGMDERAEQAIMSQIQSSLYQEYRQSQPFAPESQIERSVERDMQEIRRTGVFQTDQGPVNIKDSAAQQAALWKSSFQRNGQTYLLEIDPYYFLQNADLYRKHGYIGTELRDGVPHDTSRLSPEGRPGDFRPQFHVWLISTLLDWRGVSTEDDIADKTSVIFLIPAFFAALVVIPTFFLARKFTSDMYAFFAALVVVSVSTFVYRSVGGFMSTDSYNLLFPLTLVTFLLYGLMTQKLWLALTFGALAGFFQGLAKWAWADAWYIFLFVNLAILGHLAFAIIVNYLKQKDFSFYKKFINEVSSYAAFLVSALIFTFYFVRENVFTDTISRAFARIDVIAGTRTGNIWPNVLSSVAELNPASFNQIINSISPSTGGFIFMIALLGILGLTLDFKAKHQYVKGAIVAFAVLLHYAIIFGGAFRGLTISQPFLFLLLLFLPVGAALAYRLYCKDANQTIFLAILMSVWMAGTMFMSFNGVRFVLLLAPVIGIGFGIGMYYLAKALASATKYLSETYKTHIAAVAIIVLFIILFQPMAANAMNIARQSTPSFDDAWYDAMFFVQENTSEDAIITSWWDFGHFFRTVGQRGVTFDGASQATPQSHWVGKALLENDDEVARDILQMLTCGGNEAFNIMQNYTEDPTGGVITNKIIYKTLGQPIDETRIILQNNKYFNFTEEQTTEIMTKLACDAPVENIFITSEDMVGKAPVWAHWGLWNFSKKYILDNYRSMSAEQIAELIDEDITKVQQHIQELNQIDARARAGVARRNDMINQWLAPYPGFIPIQGRYIFGCQQTNDLIQCENSVQLNMTSGRVTSQLNAPIGRVFMPQEEGLAYITQDATAEIDVLFLPTANGYQVLLAQYPLGGSLFTRLFFLQGFGTNYFELLYDTQSTTAGRVFIWQTQWD